jgi:hypothetical protein
MVRQEWWRVLTLSRTLNPAPGTYNVHLVLNDTVYCNNPDSLEIQLRVAANVEAAFEAPPFGCAPASASFTNTSVGGDTISVEFW